MFVTKKAYQELENKYKELQLLRVPQNHEERIAELEVKIAKLWLLLTEQSQTGKDRLSKFGRRFGGQHSLNN